MSWNHVLAKNTQGYPVKINNLDVLDFPSEQSLDHSFLHNDGAGRWTWQQVDWTYVANRPTTFPPSPHDIVGADHLITASQYQLVGATAVNTLGLLTPSADPGAAIAILRSDASGDLTLQHLKLAGTSNQLVLQSGGVTGTISWTPTTLAQVLTIPDLKVTALNNTEARVFVIGTTGGNSPNVVADPTGGNVRGQYAIDFQLIRSLATQVASGTSALIIGGANNTASANYASVIGGFQNNALGLSSSVAGGYQNSAEDTYTFIGGGRSNTLSGGQSHYSVIAGGYQNTIRDQYGGILSGQGNSINGGGVGSYSTIIGGHLNLIDTSYCTIGGRRSKTNGFDSVFMWSDMTNADFNAAASNEFAIRARGGFRHAYDDSNYWAAQVSSAGAVTFNATGASAGFTFSDNVTISNTAPSLVLTDTTASAKSLTVAVDANLVNLRESAGAAGSLLVLDLANNLVGFGVAAPAYMIDATPSIRGRTSVFAKNTGTVGSVALVTGTATTTGYIQWNLAYADGASGTRLGYLGNDTANVTLNLENSANFYVSGGTFQVNPAVEAVGTNKVIAIFQHSPTNSGGSSIIRVYASALGITSIESNNGGTGPFRYGTYVDTNIVNEYTAAAGAFGNINFVTNNAVAMRITGGNSAGNVIVGTAVPTTSFEVFTPVDQQMVSFQLDSNANTHLGSILGPKYGILQLIGSSVSNENQPGTLTMLTPGVGGATQRGSEIYFIGSRSTTAQLAAATYTAVQAGDGLGRIFFGGDNAVSLRNTGAYIIGIAGSTWSSTNSEGYIDFYTTPNGSLTNTFRMRIASSGYVGINVTGPLAWLHLPASTTAAASLRINTGVAPSSPGEGDLWNDSTQKCLIGFTDGVKQFIPGSLFTQTATKTIANTTTETTLLNTGVGTVTLPANFLTAGKTVRIHLRGYFSTTGNPNIQFKLKYGATTLLDSAAFAAGTNVANQGWELVFLATCYTVGATGTVWSQGMGHLHSTHSGNIDFDIESTATVTINTTTSNALDVTATWGTADAGDTITTTNVTVEILN